MENNNPVDNLLMSLSLQSSLLQKESMKEDLAGYINYLLLHDFNKLVRILYQVDVSEEKLKELLKDQPQTDAALLIAGLLMDRQEEKLQTKNAPAPNTDIAENEKW